MGYHRAGFDVVGVDLRPQPRYPFEFHQANAVAFDLRGFDFIHASPPCQAYTGFAELNKKFQRPRLPGMSEHPRLIALMRERIAASGVPWVIENVPSPTSDLRPTFTLCGSMFDLGVRRHRWFETSVPFAAPPCRHKEQGPVIGVYGHAGANRAVKKGVVTGRGWKDHAEASAAMGGLPWMTTAEITQAIPPAYTEWIGRRLIALDR